MISITIDQLDAIVEYLSSQMKILERIQSVSNIHGEAKQKTDQEKGEK